LHNTYFDVDSLHHINAIDPSLRMGMWGGGAKDWPLPARERAFANYVKISKVCLYQVDRVGHSVLNRMHWVRAVYREANGGVAVLETEGYFVVTVRPIPT
jgi:hypothetical protein